jgi:hypothetical protein
MQAYLLTNGHNDFPGFTTLNRLPETISLSLNEDEVDVVTNDFRISRKILL